MTNFDLTLIVMNAPRTFACHLVAPRQHWRPYFDPWVRWGMA